MRKLWALSVGAIILGICWQASAQQLANQPDANSFFTGVNPRKIQPAYPVQPNNALKTRNLNQSLHKPSGMSAFNLGKIFPRKLSLGTWPPVVPNTPVLAPANNPYQPNPPKGGVNLFNPKPN